MASAYRDLHTCGISNCDITRGRDEVKTVILNDYAVKHHNEKASSTEAFRSEWLSLRPGLGHACDAGWKFTTMGKQVSM